MKNERPNYDPAELARYAKAASRTMFTDEDIATAIEQIEATPILGMLTDWQAEDRAGKRGGGRPEALNFRALLVANHLVLAENHEQLLTGMSNFFVRRISVEARKMLGIDHVAYEPTAKAEAQRWYDRTVRCFQRLIALMDAYPAPKQFLDTDERRYQKAIRDEFDQEVRRTRVEYFGNEMLEMTFRELPVEAQEAWGGSISVDQTKVPAVSSRGAKRKVEVEGQEEKEEPNCLVMEIDAGWYTHAAEHRGKDGERVRDASWAYAANFATMTQENPDLPFPGHPNLLIALNVGKPNANALPEETMRLIESIKERGHKTSRFTGDREYLVGQTAERMAIPLLEAGYKQLTDYRVDQLGVQGQVGGAQLVEGRFYCPAMPVGIRDATKLFRQGKITREVWLRRVREERPQYEARRKEKPDATGAFPIMCPAVGAGATIDCPLRAVHAKASQKTRDEVAKPPAEHQQDRICRQTSVAVKPGKHTKYYQETLWASDEWMKLYAYDRNTVEGYNSTIKDGGKEDLENTALRRARGRTAATFFVIMAAVNANRRLTQTWLRQRDDFNNGITKAKRKPTIYGIARLEDHQQRHPRMRPDGTVTAGPRRQAA